MKKGLKKAMMESKTKETVSVLCVCVCVCVDVMKALE